MCGKQRSYKSFVFVSAARKRLTGDYFASAVTKGLRKKSKFETRNPKIRSLVRTEGGNENREGVAGRFHKEV
jgi:hypothetical protein